MQIYSSFLCSHLLVQNCTGAYPLPEVTELNALLISHSPPKKASVFKFLKIASFGEVPRYLKDLSILILSREFLYIYLILYLY